MAKRYAEDVNYFDTLVHPGKSLGEIQSLLEDFGADNYQVSQGQSGGKYAWLIRFSWKNKPYRFAFMPIECRQPVIVRTFAGKKRSNEEQSRWQMGRIAYNFVKAILTAAEMHPHALFGFMEISAGTKPGQLPRTAGELDVDNLVRALPSDFDDLPMLSITAE